MRRVGEGGAAAGHQDTRALSANPSHCATRHLVCSSRGIDADTARRVLVTSFGREVVAGLPTEALRTRVDAACADALAKAGAA